METVIFVNQAHMGHGNPELGARILKTFLQKARSLAGLEAILLVNGGVQLVRGDSPVRAELAMLEEQGVEIIPCGTCLEALSVDPAVGCVGSMDQIIKALSDAGKVISL